MAFCVPSGCGIAVMPTKPPCLMSDSDALATPTTVAYPASLTVTFAPSRAVTFSVEPLTLSIVPRNAVPVPAQAQTSPQAPQKADASAKFKLRHVIAPKSLLARFQRQTP